jgi:hypothetical protein
VTQVGAPPNDWVTDPALLARVLTRLRQWGEPAAPPSLTGHPEFGVSCRRADPADPPVDVTMPSNSGRSLVACPPPLFRRPVGPTERRP